MVRIQDNDKIPGPAIFMEAWNSNNHITSQIDPAAPAKSWEASRWLRVVSRNGGSSLRANGFKTFIVSGGGIEFIRPWTEATYGIPPEQVVGSSITTQYELRDGKPVSVRLPEVSFIDDKEGKPVGINSHIGRRPIFAGGNSDGDWQMIQYTTIGRSPSFGLIVHHTDAEREWAYDRDSHIGQLDKALDDVPRRGWTVVDMKNDWKTIYPAK